MPKSKRARKLTSPPSDQAMIQEEDIANVLDSPPKITSPNSMNNKSTKSNKSSYKRPPFKSVKDTETDLQDFVDIEEE